MCGCVVGAELGVEGGSEGIPQSCPSSGCVRRMLDGEQAGKGKLLEIVAVCSRDRGRRSMGSFM